MVASYPQFGLTFGGPRASFFAQYKVCEEADKSLYEIETAKYLDTVFPGEDGVITKHVSASYFAGDKDSFKLLLIGCIAYESAKGGPYHTRVIYSMIRSQEAESSKDGKKSYPIIGFERQYTDTQ